MNILMCCLLVGIFSLAFADIKYEENNVDKVTSEKYSESKSKRDAFLLVDSYYGPSHKYLPPSSVFSYDSYTGSKRPFSGVYNSGNGYSFDGTGHTHGRFGGLAHRDHNSGITHSIGYAPKNTYPSKNHHDLGYTTTHSTGHGSVTQLSGRKGNGGSLNTGYRSSTSGNNGLKSNPHFIFGRNFGHSASSVNKFYHPKVLSGLFSSSGSSGLGVDHTRDSSQGIDLSEVHHGDHVHNSGQEHLYIVSSGSSNLEGVHQGVIELPSVSYSTHVRQHPLPSSSHDVPIENVGDTFSKKFNQYTSGAQGPTYAAGHKGLGHFSFTLNKPQLLHTSISGLSFKQAESSKVPFKPSTFLGAEYEETSHDNFVSQHLPTTSVSHNTGYDYPIAPDSSIIYQQENYAQSLEVPSASIQEPDSSYLPPNSNEGSFKEITSPIGNYLPPDNSYGNSYSH